MRVSCPKCQTEYEVPDAALTGRSRTLRCATCMTKWRVPALEMFRQSGTEPAAPEPAAPEPEPAAAGAEPAAADKDAGAALLQDACPAQDKAMAKPEPGHPNPLQATRERLQAAGPAPSAARGLVISVLLVLLIIGAVLVEHRAIGAAWPPSLRLFNAIGLY